VTDWVDLLSHLGSPKDRHVHAMDRRASAPKLVAGKAAARRTGVPLWMRALIILGASIGLWAVIIVGLLSLVRA